MISVTFSTPCAFFVFHPHPRPLGPLNPGEESNFFGDELYVNIVKDFINVKKRRLFLEIFDNQ